MYACNCDLEFFLLPERVKLVEESEEPLAGWDYEDDDEDKKENEADDYEADDEDEEELEEGVDDDDDHRIPPPSPTPSLEVRNHLLEIKEGLYIALADDEASIGVLRTFDLKLFTHLVHVTYATPMGNKLPLITTQMQRLDITCPAASLHLPADQTAVDSLQLGAARDFLTLVLPHGSAKWWPEEQRRVGKVGDWRDGRLAQDEQSMDADTQFVMLAPGGPDEFQNEQDEPELQADIDINALIVAPTGRPVDVVSILYCYLAFLEGTTADNLTLDGYYDPLWAEVTLGPQTMGQVNLMARSI